MENNIDKRRRNSEIRMVITLVIIGIITIIASGIATFVFGKSPKQTMPFVLSGIALIIGGVLLADAIPSPPKSKKDE